MVIEEEAVEENNIVEDVVAAVEEVKPTVPVMELSDDPNKALSPDDIAALFASMGQ